MVQVINEQTATHPQLAPEPTPRGPYGRHDRYWIPLRHRGALNFYFRNLFVAHSRLELALGSLARISSPASLLDCSQSDLFVQRLLGPQPDPANDGAERPADWADFDHLVGSLETTLLEKGVALRSPLEVLALEDYQETGRCQTVLFLFEGEAPVPCAIAKTTQDTAHRSVLEQELSALDALHSTLEEGLRATIPKPLALLRLHNLTVLVETPMPGRSFYFQMRNTWRPSRYVHDHFERARRWLVQFQQATQRGEKNFDQSALEQDVAAPLERFLELCDPCTHERRMIADTLALARKLIGERIPLVACQGDFWARNLIDDNGTALGVVDWERFRPAGLPFSDLFMFATSYALSYAWKLGFWSNPAAAFCAAFMSRSSLSYFVRGYLARYGDETHLTAQMLEVFFTVFLAQRSLEEVQPSLGEDLSKSETEIERSSPAALQKTVPTRRLWRSLFLEYAQNGGSACFG